MHPIGNFDPIRAVKGLLREADTGALASLMPDGSPYVSLVTVAALPEGAPILLLSKLARHTTNIVADPRVSILLEQDRPGDPLERIRVSLSGNIAGTDDSIARRRFLARHPSAETYAGFADFGFWRIEPTGAHLVAGFGRIADLKAADLRTAIDDAEKLLVAEEDVIAHMNEDHLDAIELYATKLLGDGPGPWRIVSLDPEGCDLKLGKTVRRLEFPNRVTNPDELRKTMVVLVKKARAG